MVKERVILANDLMIMINPLQVALYGLGRLSLGLCP